MDQSAVVHREKYNQIMQDEELMLQEMLALFEAADQNQDGYISADELKDFFMFFTKELGLDGVDDIFLG